MPIKGILVGTAAQRAAYDTALLAPGQWWAQISTDDIPVLEGYYFWSGSAWFLDPKAKSPSQWDIETAAYPTVTLTRISSAATGGANAFRLVARTVADMIDGFGGGFRIAIEDIAGITQDIAQFLAVRAQGADDGGLLLFGVNETGTPDTSLGVGIPNIRSVLELDHKGRLRSYWPTIASPAPDTLKSPIPRTFATYTGLTVVANTAAETTLLGAAILGTLTLPANYMDLSGRTIRVTASGYFSATGTPTLNIKLKLGSVTLMITGAVALSGTIADHHWEMSALFTVSAVGAAGTVLGQGNFAYDNAAHAGIAEGMVMIAAATIDMTAAQAIDLTATWGAAAAGNTITCTNYVVEVLS